MRTLTVDSVGKCLQMEPTVQGGQLGGKLRGDSEGWLLGLWPVLENGDVELYSWLTCKVYRITSQRALLLSNLVSISTVAFLKSGLYATRDLSVRQFVQDQSAYLFNVSSTGHRKQFPSSHARLNFFIFPDV